MENVFENEFVKICLEIKVQFWYLKQKGERTFLIM